MNGFLPRIVLAGGLLLASRAAAAPNGCDGDLRDLDGVDYTDFEVAAAMMDSVPVAYPEVAIRAWLEGEVVLEVAVLPTGDPVCAVVRTSVHPLLDRAALEAALASRYLAASRQGEPVPGTALVAYAFDPAAELAIRYPPRDPERFPWTGPMVSESAESVEHGGHDCWVFRGLRIHGDLSVAVLEEIMAEVTARLGEGEVPDSVWMDPTGGHGLPWEYEANGDIRVDTCLRRRADGLCSRGNVYVFFLRDGKFELEMTSMFFAD